MKLFSAHIEDLRTLYISNLKKALDMEQKITKALPTMVEKASDPDLSTAFNNHLEQTRGHVAKVESILRNAIGDAKTTTCKVIGALTTEAEDNIKDAKDPGIRDISLIASAQQVEHHEMAVYGTLRTWAEELGYSKSAKLLQQTLDEERATDTALTKLAKAVINLDAESEAA